MVRSFRVYMAMMRKRDPLTQEEGFYSLLAQASRYVDELIDEFRREEDVGLRRWLLELIAEAKSPKAFPLFVESLYGEEEGLRRWAALGLQRLGSKEARRVLWEARSHCFATQEETQAFRQMLDEVQQR